MLPVAMPVDGIQEVYRRRRSNKTSALIYRSLLPRMLAESQFSLGEILLKLLIRRRRVYTGTQNGATFAILFPVKPWFHVKIKKLKIFMHEPPPSVVHPKKIVAVHGSVRK